MSKKLVLYFSVYGTSKKIAKIISELTGADLVEIEPKVPYDSNRDHYDDLAKYAKKEHDENMRPEIKNDLHINDYDIIYIGYPMWWYTFPMIVYTMFDKYDFNGKTIIPFNTHMGSSDGGTYKIIKELAKGANVLKGLPVEMKMAESEPKELVENWLKEIKQI